MALVLPVRPNPLLIGGSLARRHAATSTLLADPPNPLPRPGVPQNRPPLRLVPGGAGQRRPRATGVVVLVACTLLFLTLAAALLVVHVRMSQDSFTLTELEAQVAAEAERIEELRVAVAELESPGRVLAMAQGALGMTDAADAQYLYVAAEDVPSPPGPGD